MSRVIQQFSVNFLVTKSLLRCFDSDASEPLPGGK